jgi:hypothetical protein
MLDEFAELTQRVHAHSPLVRSEAHGDHHWRLIAWTGYHLMQEVPTVDSLTHSLTQRKLQKRGPSHSGRSPRQGCRVVVPGSPQFS